MSGMPELLPAAHCVMADAQKAELAVSAGRSIMLCEAESTVSALKG